MFFLCVSALNIFRVGLDIPTIEVRFEHLNVEAEAYIGSRAMPTMFNFSVNMLEVINSSGFFGYTNNYFFFSLCKTMMPFSHSVTFCDLQGFLSNLHILPSRKKSFPILQDVSGIIKPRRYFLISQSMK